MFVSSFAATASHKSRCVDSRGVGVSQQSQHKLCGLLSVQSQARRPHQCSHFCEKRSSYEHARHHFPFALDKMLRQERHLIATFDLCREHGI